MPRPGKERDSGETPSRFQILKTNEKKEGEKEAFNRQLDLLLKSYIKALVGGDKEYQQLMSNGGIPRDIKQQAEEAVREVRDQLGDNLSDLPGVVRVGAHSLEP